MFYIKIVVSLIDNQKKGNGSKTKYIIFDFVTFKIAF